MSEYIPEASRRHKKWTAPLPAQEAAMRAGVRRRQEASRNDATDVHGIPLGRGKMFPYLSHISKTRNRPLSGQRRIAHMVDGGLREPPPERTGVRKLRGPQSEHADWMHFRRGRRLLKPHRDGFHEGPSDRRRILKAVVPKMDAAQCKLQYGGRNNELSTGIIQIEDKMMSKRRLQAPPSKRFNLALAMGRKKHLLEPRTACAELAKGVDYKPGYFALSRTERTARLLERRRQKQSKLQQRGGGSAGHLGTGGIDPTGMGTDAEGSSPVSGSGNAKGISGNNARMQQQGLRRPLKISFDQKRRRRLRAMDMADVASLRRWELQTGKQLNDFGVQDGDVDDGELTQSGTKKNGLTNALQLTLGKWLDEPATPPAKGLPPGMGKPKALKLETMHT